MSAPALKRKQQQYYTYEDYLTWEDNIRYELINGKVYAMSAPSREHQRILVELCLQLGNYLKGKSCRLFVAPFDVRLNAQTRDDTVVQPDLLVVCDKDKLDKKSCVGAPDMIIEIESPSTARTDRVTKYNLYQNAGVREYWLVDPENKTVQVCILENGNYYMKAYEETDTAPVTILEDCTINLADVFTGPEEG